MYTCKLPLCVILVFGSSILCVYIRWGCMCKMSLCFLHYMSFACMLLCSLVFYCVCCYRSACHVASFAWRWSRSPVSFSYNRAMFVLMRSSAHTFETRIHSLSLSMSLYLMHISRTHRSPCCGFLINWCHPLYTNRALQEVSISITKLTCLQDEHSQMKSNRDTTLLMRTIIRFCAWPFAG